MCEAAKAADAKPLVENTPLDVGSGVTLTFTKKQTHAGGDNQPPTMKHTVTAKCSGKEVVVYTSEDEGGNADITAHTASGTVTVHVTMHIAREGEFEDQHETAALDVASCAVTKK